MAHKLSLAAEVAGAATALENDLPTKTSKRIPHSNAAIIDEAKRLQRLQTRRKALRRQLRQVEADIRHSRQMLRALAGGR